MLDLLIKNGHMIDPANRIDQIRNIAIYSGKITRYEEREPARHVVDAAGRYVFPGLINAYTHMFQEETEIDIYPDMAYSPTGVTSAIGFSTGAANYPIFRSAVVARSRVTIKGLLQVCPAGLTTTSYHEYINPKFFSPEKTVHMYHDNQDNILGLKIHQNEELAEELGIEPLKKAIRIAGMAGCPVEVHYTSISVSISEVPKILRPGDIFERIYQEVKNTITDENGKLYDCVREARKWGIISDTAEGREHDDSDVTLKTKEQGFITGVCGTNLVLGNIFRRPTFSLLNLMFRHICMKVPMSQVVSTITEYPAGLMRIQGEIGCLSEGARANVAIFRRMDFRQTYKGRKETTFTADKLLEPGMTVRDGQIMYCVPDYIYENWV